jgi:MFS family permease
VATELFLDSEELVVLGDAFGAGGGANLDLAAAGGDNEVGDERVFGLAGAVGNEGAVAGFAGRADDRLGTTRVLAAGAALFLLAYAGLAATGPSFALLGACFVAAGLGIGCAETAEHAAVAQLASEGIRGQPLACSPPCRAPATSPPAR